MIIIGLTCCFTGHRPNKLKGGYDWNNIHNIRLGLEIRKVVINLIESQNADTFISGGALGIDQMSFFIINKLKKEYPNIKNILVIPFKLQYKNWIKESIDRYTQAKHLADKIIYVDLLEDYSIKGLNPYIYHPSKMQMRNKYMVDKSDIVIAIWDGTKGGTKNCIDYAKKCGKKIIYINPNEV